MIHPIVSVIIPTYNRKALVINTINSVLNQTYKNYEIIVIDDGSTDNTYNYLKSTFKNINLIKTPHKGVSSARNKGILKSRGKYLAFLDSDDLWKENKLEKHVIFMENYSNLMISHTDETWIRNNKEVNKPKKYKKTGGFVFPDCIPLTMIGASTVVLKKELLDEVGLFDEKMPTCEDYDLWLRISAKHEVGYIDDQLTIKFGGHEDQLSLTEPFQDKWRVYTLLKLLKSNINNDLYDYIYPILKKKCEIIIHGLIKKHLNEEILYYEKILKCISNKKEDLKHIEI